MPNAELNDVSKSCGGLPEFSMRKASTTGPRFPRITEARHRCARQIRSRNTCSTLMISRVSGDDVVAPGHHIGKRIAHEQARRGQQAINDVLKVLSITHRCKAGTVTMRRAWLSETDRVGPLLAPRAIAADRHDEEQNQE